MSGRMLADNSTNAHFNEVQMDSLMNAAIIVSAISFIGSVTVIWSYWYFEKLQKFAFKLVVMLAISDVGSGIGYFLGSPPNGVTCTIQGVMLHYFQLSSFAWTTVIAFVLERTVCRQQGAWVETKRHYLHIFAWGVPLVLVLLPFSTAHLMPNGYAYSNTFREWADKDVGAWCWIAKDDGDIGTMWRFTTFYAPLWTAMAYNFYNYHKVIKTLRTTLNNQEQGDSEAHKTKLKIVRRLRWYPAILFICWFFGTVNRIQNAISPHGPIFWLYMAHAIFSSMQGGMNSLIYGLNKAVQAAWREKFPGSANYCDRMCCIFTRLCGASYSSAQQKVELSKGTGGDGKVSI